MARYLKAFIAAVGALAMTLQASAADQAISFDEAHGIWLAVLAVGTALGVYAVPNRE